MIYYTTLISGGAHKHSQSPMDGFRAALGDGMLSEIDQCRGKFT